MGDRSKSLPECTQVRIKCAEKTRVRSVGLVYDPRGLAGVTTV
jgi:hypothetical protein